MSRKRGGDIRLYKSQSPCYDCPKRWRTDTQSCHDTCKTYQDYRKDVNGENEKRKEYYKKRDAFMEYLCGKRDTPAR